MEAVLITVYLIIALALIAVILLQRSEGGGLGMGGGSSTGLLTVRGSANLLTRTTAILAALFFATAIGLTILSGVDSGTRSILERAADSVGEGADAPTTVLDALNALQPADSGLPVPAPGGTTAPAETAPPAADPGLAVPTSPTAPTDGDEPATSETPAAPVN